MESLEITGNSEILNQASIQCQAKHHSNVLISQRFLMHHVMQMNFRKKSRILYTMISH